MKKSLFVLFAAAAVWSCTKEPLIADGPAVDIPETSVPDDNNIVSGWVRIKLAEDATPLKVGEFTRGTVDSGDPRLDEIAQQLGATEICRVFSDGGKFAERRRRYGLHLWYDIKIGEDVPVSRAEAGIASIPGIAHVQPIYQIELTGGTPVPAEMSDRMYRPASMDASRPVVEMPFNDPDLPKQWHYYNNGSLPNAAEGADINLFKGWEITTGSPEVIVAVVDMGVQYDHPDLAANMWINEAEINGTPGVDDDNNGYVDDIYGWNFARDYNSGEIIPGYHGTHIAGTIAAVNNNGIGVSGVAGGSGNGDGARIMTVTWSVNSKSTIPNYDMFAYAADNGAVIASCSWNVESPSIAPDLLAGLDYFIDNAGTDENGNQIGPMKGGLCVFASGNDNKNRLRHPLDYERVVCVASMAPDYNRASYSNYAPEVDILSPGGDKNFGEEYAVYSTFNNSDYGYLDGTSMATPHVSGVAALIVSKYGGPDFTVEDLRRRLLASTRPISHIVPEVYANQIGVGLIDASLIDLEDPRTAPQPLEDYGAEGLPDSLRIYCKVPADGNGMPVVKYLTKYAEVRNGAPGEWIDLELVNTNNVGEEYEYGFELVQKTTYAVKMTPVDRFGNLGEEVSFEATTLKHTNRAPRQKAKFLDLESQKPGERYAKKFQLAYYFVDEDIEKYGDALSFTASSSDSEIAETILEDDGRLTVMPLKKGIATITIRATDLGGLYAEVSFTLTVLEDAYTNQKPRLIRELGSLRLEGTGEEYKRVYSLQNHFTDPNLADGDVLSFALLNSGETVVKAEISGNDLVVTPLAEGTASVTVTATDKAGESVESVLTVQVGKGTVPSGGELTLATNPVGETLELGLTAGAGRNATVVIYDAAARKVMDGSITFNDDGQGSMDVSALSPGIYTVDLSCEAGKYRINFLKR